MEGGFEKVSVRLVEAVLMEAVEADLAHWGRVVRLEPPVIRRALAAAIRRRRDSYSS